MSDYARVYNFTAKDALTTGDPNKLVKGSEVDAELNAIVTAIATKANDSAAAHLTGTETLTGKTLTSPVINSSTGIGQVITKYKSSDESRTSDTTLDALDDLTIGVGASEVWVAMFDIHFSSADLNAGGLKFTVLGGSGATGTIRYDILNGSTTGLNGVLAVGGTFAGSTFGAGSTNAVLRLTVHLINGSALADGFRVQFAQNTSSATSITAKAGSFAQFVRIS